MLGPVASLSRFLVWCVWPHDFSDWESCSTCLPYIITKDLRCMTLRRLRVAGRAANLVWLCAHNLTVSLLAHFVVACPCV